jgi:hypothetical protein
MLLLKLRLLLRLRLLSRRSRPFSLPLLAAAA